MALIERIHKDGTRTFWAAIYQGGRMVWVNCGHSPQIAKQTHSLLANRGHQNQLSTMRDIKVSVLVDKFFAEGCHDRRSQTIDTYRSRVKNHLMPFFGDIRVRQGCTTDRINQWIVWERHQGVSDTTIRLALTTLGALLSYAVDINLIHDNPCHRVRPPKIVDGGVEHTLTPVEVALVIKNTPDKNGDRILMTYLAMVGCRPSEAVEARFADVDWHNHTITISRTAVRKSTTNLTGTNPTKTGKTRVVPLSASLLLALSGEKRRLRATADDLMFPTVTGKRRQPQRFASEVLRPALTRSGLRVPGGSRSLLILRKSCASNLLQQGESPKMVSELLGQSPHVLLKHYTKIRTEDATAAIDRLDAMMVGDKRDTKGTVVQIA